MIDHGNDREVHLIKIKVQNGTFFLLNSFQVPTHCLSLHCVHQIWFRWNINIDQTCKLIYFFFTRILRRRTYLMLKCRTKPQNSLLINLRLNSLDVLQIESWSAQPRTPCYKSYEISGRGLGATNLNGQWLLDDDDDTSPSRCFAGRYLMSSKVRHVQRPSCPVCSAKFCVAGKRVLSSLNSDDKLIYGQHVAKFIIHTLRDALRHL